MLRVFQNDVLCPDKFVVTLELVPGREASGRSVDTVMGIARDAYSDGRISAVSMTDNPGGNPALSPDVLGYEIFKIGLDVIVHFTCRDMNRVGMESRALQLAMMGMKNILALTGDYSGRGFGGQGAPVFDIDSVQLQILFGMLNDRLLAGGDPDPFFSGCAVSPFKYTEAESFAQYAKLCRKAAAGAKFVITQLGYDADKFAELMRMMRSMGWGLPVFGSVYVLTPAAARIMNAGKVPGALVSDPLLRQVEDQWRHATHGCAAAIERGAQLAAVLKGLGYKGIHIGGIHRNFDLVGRLLDRMSHYESQWPDIASSIQFSDPGGFRAYPADAQTPTFGRTLQDLSTIEKMRFSFLRRSHDIFFDRRNLLSPFFRKICALCDGTWAERVIMDGIEDPIKRMMLNCMRCGDCGIQHVGFLCPESGCPKHMRNGACGGSRIGKCEVYPDRDCIWVRAYSRLAHIGKSELMVKGCVPPRMWELNQSSSWFNFHLQRDHQYVSSDIVQRCQMSDCLLG
jgi:methylenetetrahydrofolate reductase (NADPH)